jgi:uncharacterized iron-regulated membrane protein
MTRGTIRAWAVVHRWSSLVSTAFLLMLCVTGLPLIFHEEIDALTGHAPAELAGEPSSAEGAGLPLDAILARALAARPGETPLFMAFSNEGPLTTVTTGAAPDAAETAMTLQLFDRKTGRPAGAPDAEGGMMEVILRLHVDMFFGLPGKLFLGAMGALFVLAIVSGVVLYAPFMRRYDFGTLRTERSRRVKWLDYHNLLGVVTLAWAGVVGATGVVNALSEPIVQTWRADELARMTRPGQGAVAKPTASLDAAMASVRRARPGLKPQFIAWPGGAFSSARHYAVFLQGATPATERLLTIALVDAQTGALDEVRPLPWYMQALLLSQPLHFGDYGGNPLKLLWAALDLFTIVVLGSGLYLWAARRKSWGRHVAARADRADFALAPAE